MDTTIHWLNLFPVDNATGLIFLVVEISCFHTEHLGVLKNSLKRVPAFQIELEFESVGFKGEGKTKVPGKNLSE